MNKIISNSGEYETVIQDDGNLVTYRSGVAVWASGVTQPESPDPPPPPPPPTGEFVPITLGNWRGNFLYPATDYFMPACASLSQDQRLALFARERTRGQTHLVVNAQQDDWGPREGNPAYTHGGYNAYVDLPGFVAILQEIRAAGLQPVVGCIDQPWLREKSLDDIIALTRDLVDATWEHVSLYQLSWEINDVWRFGQERNPNIERWITSVDWRGRDCGIHYNPPRLGADDNVMGGFDFYGRLPPNTVRLHQFPNAIGDAELTERITLGIEVNAGTNTGYCFDEATGIVRRTPAWPESKATERANLARTIMASWLPLSRTGSLNG